MHTPVLDAHDGVGRLASGGQRHRRRARTTGAGPPTVGAGDVRPVGAAASLVTRAGHVLNGGCLKTGSQLVTVNSLAAVAGAPSGPAAWWSSSRGGLADHHAFVVLRFNRDRVQRVLTRPGGPTAPTCADERERIRPATVTDGADPPVAASRGSVVVVPVLRKAVGVPGGPS